MGNEATEKKKPEALELNSPEVQAIFSQSQSERMKISKKPSELETIKEDDSNTAITGAVDDAQEESLTIQKEAEVFFQFLPAELSDIKKQLKDAYKDTPLFSKARQEKCKNYRAFLEAAKWIGKQLEKYGGKLKDGRYEVNRLKPEHTTEVMNEIRRRRECCNNNISLLTHGLHPGQQHYLSPNPGTGNRQFNHLNEQGPSQEQIQKAGDSMKKSCGGSYGSYAQERNKLVHNNMSGLNGFGKNVACALPLVVTGVAAYQGIKALRDMRGSDPAKANAARGKLALSAGVIVGLHGVDPKRVSGLMSEKFNTTPDGKKTNNREISKIVRDGLANGTLDIENDKVREQYAPSLVGGALLGATHSEALQVVKFTSDDRPVGIDYGKLKGFYHQKQADPANTDNRKQYVDLELEVVHLEDAMSKMTASEKQAFLGDAFTRIGLSKDILSDPSQKDIPVSNVVAHYLKTMEVANDFFEKIALEDVIFKATKGKALREFLKDKYPAEKLMNEIMKLPKEMRDQLYEGNIVLKQDPQGEGLIFSSYGDGTQAAGVETVILLSNGTFTGIKVRPQNSNVTIDSEKQKFGPFTSLNEAMRAAHKTNELINNNHHKYLISEPFFYKKQFMSGFRPFGQQGNEIAVSQGETQRLNPNTRLFGKHEAVVNGWFDGVPKEYAGIRNDLDKYKHFLNGLRVRQDPKSSIYIHDNILPELKAKFPGLSDVAYTQMINTYSGQYLIRGDYQSLLSTNATALKNGSIKLATDAYNVVTTTLGDARDGPEGATTPGGLVGLKNRMKTDITERRVGKDGQIGVKDKLGRSLNFRGWMKYKNGVDGEVTDFYSGSADRLEKLRQITTKSVDLNLGIIDNVISAMMRVAGVPNNTNETSKKEEESEREKRRKEAKEAASGKEETKKEEKPMPKKEETTPKEETSKTVEESEREKRRKEAKEAASK